MIADNDMLDFLSEQEIKLKKKSTRKRSFKLLERWSLSPTQCLYVSNYKKRKITFQRGVSEMLGYKEDEFDHNLIHTFIHPEDIDMVQRLTKAAIAYVIDRNLVDDGQMFLTYRARKKNGEYLKVMRQTNVFEKDGDGRFISNLSVLTDVSFMSTVNSVDWKFIADDLDAEEFKDYVKEEYDDFFSDREKQIILCIAQGMQSYEIAGLLDISKHTVDTHRRNLLKKAGCKSTIELVSFCQKNGII
jgi:DNA-binding CsgD family transcriptional regulator